MIFHKSWCCAKSSKCGHAFLQDKPIICTHHFLGCSTESSYKLDMPMNGTWTCYVAYKLVETCFPAVISRAPCSLSLRLIGIFKNWQGEHFLNGRFSIREAISYGQSHVVSDCFLMIAMDFQCPLVLLKGLTWGFLLVMTENTSVKQSSIHPSVHLMG